ncbi:hypothetical protein TrST_g8973 [Triparma strigata]|uniref:Aromatic amino acid beta-eliminating lyase/threonine aldolase domain-containing protein n=1 Tax=Triparma strigata TaxID=1606541 RepID=A0A9W7B839_9STRA|nr:hypothetical protein TrST_g8973 [Triparma strigata]
MHLQMPNQYPPPPLHDLISNLSLDLTYLSLPPSTPSDYYGDFPSTPSTSYLRLFESHLSRTFKADDCVFMPSGVMAQSIILMSKCRDPDSMFLCHKSSHLLLHEQDSYSNLLNKKPIIIDTSSPITYSSVLSSLNASPSIKILILEHPHRELGGTLTSYSDLLKIQELCKERNVWFHIDGARIWEAQGASNGEYTLHDLKGLCDSMYVSFYKGLGGITGAALLGGGEVCEEARVWLRRFGGNLYTLSPYVVSCWAGFKRNVEDADFTFIDKANKMKSVYAALKADQEVSEVLQFRTETVEICFCHGIINGTREECEEAERKVFEKTGVHVFSRLRGEWEGGRKMYFEWNMGNVNGRIGDEVYLENWQLLAREMKALKEKK